VAHEVGPSLGLRFVCYCHDCQAFARFLERSDVLDSAGGTDIFQMPPARLELSSGMDALRSLRLSDRGVLRWYAECCRTPIANTAPGFPIVGVIHSFMDHEADGRSREEALGPPRCGIFARSATGRLPEPAPPPPSLGLFVRRTSLLVGWKLRGLGRRSLFFDDRTGAPLVEPRVLSKEERAP
jgi:hypothetical protein